MLNKVSENNSKAAFKMCFDSKRINACKTNKSGDIDLFGFENEPTLKARWNRLTEDLKLADTVKEKIHKISDTVESLKDFQPADKRIYCKKIQTVINLLSKRLQNLRQLKVTQEASLQKFKKLGTLITTQWRASKYAYVISIQASSLFEVNDCVEDILNTINKLCEECAVLNSCSHLYSSASEIDLNAQENILCLADKQPHGLSSTVEPRYTKQRSSEWFDIRKEAKLTGSTLNAALGLDTLKSRLSTSTTLLMVFPDKNPTSLPKRKCSTALIMRLMLLRPWSEWCCRHFTLGYHVLKKGVMLLNKTAKSSWW
jgi:hypothetical protein